jgi:hypothetical protein
MSKLFTPNPEEQTCKTPIEELRASALKHYEEASSAIHHWSSFVENAIKAYNPAPSTDAPVLNAPKTDFQIAWDIALSKDKPFYIDIVRELYFKHEAEEISFSKFVGELNVAAVKWSSLQCEAKDAAIKELLEFTDDVANNYDCDTDAHKYNTRCRSCEAKKLIQKHKPTTVEGR